ncbi:SPOR domain-containing protein [Orbaceae bacterium ac157xtp]
MNEPIRADKEDRYLSKTDNKNNSQLTKPISKLFKPKRLFLLLILLIILLLLSFIIFKPTQTITTDNEQNPTQNSPATQNGGDNAVTVLTPPSISSQATQTQQTNINDKERIEIPGEVTDLLSQKIIELKSENKTVNPQLHELELHKTLPDNHYTIQLLASSSLQSIMASVKANKLSNYQIYETKRNDKPWFILIKGNYATLDEAKQAIQYLPAEWQKNAPWIKTGITVNKEKISNAH